MRVLGIVLFVAGAAATVQALRLAFSSRRPRDLAYALGAPVALVAAVIGLVLVFAPGLLG
jgi:hypothetical protein